MGIEAFGESLLSEQRQRNRQRRKEAERAALTSTLIGLGVKVGNKLLADQTQNFMNTEAFRSARQVARAADQNGSFWKTEQDRVRQSNKSDVGYYTDYYEPLVRQRLEEEIPERERIGNYESVVAKRSRELALEQAQRLRKATELLADPKATDFEKQVALIAKDYRPDTVGEMLLSKMTGMFTGKSQEDLDREEILALKSFVDEKPDEGSRAYYAQQLSTLRKLYMESGDLMFSKNVVKDLGINKPKPEDQFFESQDVQFKTVGDSLIKVIKTDKFEPKGPGGLTKPISSNTTQERVTNIETDEEAVAEAMKSFDILKFVQDNFDEPRVGDFVAAVNKSVPDGIGGIDSQEEYLAYVKVFNEWASNPMNYEDKRQETLYNDTMKIAMEQMDASAFEFIVETDTTLRFQKMQKFFSLLSDFSRNAENLSSERASRIIDDGRN